MRTREDRKWEAIAMSVMFWAVIALLLAVMNVKVIYSQQTVEPRLLGTFVFALVYVVVIARSETARKYLMYFWGGTSALLLLASLVALGWGEIGIAMTALVLAAASNFFYQFLKLAVDIEAPSRA